MNYPAPEHLTHANVLVPIANPTSFCFEPSPVLSHRVEKVFNGRTWIEKPITIFRCKGCGQTLSVFNDRVIDTYR